MKYIFKFSSFAEKKFTKLPKALQARMLDKIEFWEAEGDTLTFGKKMQGYKNQYRFRIGDYRLICKQKADGSLAILSVLNIDHRSRVYQ